MSACAQSERNQLCSAKLFSLSYQIFTGFFGPLVPIHSKSYQNTWYINTDIIIDSVYTSQKKILGTWVKEWYTTGTCI